MTQQPTTIARALASLPGRVREQLSHLSITTAPGLHLTCHTLGPEPAADGPLTGEPDLDQQLAQLAQMDIVGQLEVTTSDTRTTVTLWSDQRQEWTHRMELLRAHPHAGADLLERVARTKLERARWQAAARSATERAAEARTSGLAEATITALLQASSQPPGPAPHQTPSVPARTPEPPDREGFVRMPMGHDAPCVVCDRPATHTFRGQPLHQGECTNLYLDGIAPTPPQRRHDPPQRRHDPPPQPAPAAAPTRPSPAARTSTKKKATTKKAAAPSRSRFAAAVIAWDGHHLYLPGREKIPHTDVRHLGKLAQLVTTYRLGHGGGAARPDRGEVLIFPSAMEQLGLPVEVARSGYGHREARNRAREEIFGEFTPLGVVQDALAEGWHLAGERMDVRTLITDPDRPSAGAQVTVLSWMDWQGNPLFARSLSEEDREVLADPQTVVDRLQQFADLGRGSWRISPGQTGIDLVDIGHPPLRAGSEPDGQHLISGQRPDLPAFLAPKARRDDSRFARPGEEVFGWYRPWSSLGEEEKARRVVIAYDHGANFLGPFTSTELPIGDLRIHTGEEARWDGREIPGYWMVSAPDWSAPMWNLPNPTEAGGFIVGTYDGHQNVRIVTAYTLKQLQMLDPELPEALTYHQAWIWHDSARLLRPVGDALTDVITTGSPEVAAAGKQVYAQMVQKFASLTYPPPQQHLRLPPVRDFIVGAARTSILRTLLAIFETTGLSPLAVSRDTIFYAVDEEDPQAAWPGDPSKYGTGKGKWKPTGIAPLHEWGPLCLPEPRPNLGTRFDYGKAMARMTALDPATGQPIEEGEHQ